MDAIGSLEGARGPLGTYLAPGEPQAAFSDRMRRLVRLLRDEASGGACVALLCHSDGR